MDDANPVSGRDRAPAVPSAQDAMRGRLAYGDAMMGTIAPILGHLVLNHDQSLFNDEIVARVRGMLESLARQLLDAKSGLEEPRQTAEIGDKGESEVSESASEPVRNAAALAQRLAAAPDLLRHCHALALEYRLTRRLKDRTALDPVLSPLVQALVASADAKEAERAMGFLAAQARFMQQQQRMALPFSELSAELANSALAAWRAHTGESETSLEAETAIRAQVEPTAADRAGRCAGEGAGQGTEKQHTEGASRVPFRSGAVPLDARGRWWHGAGRERSDGQRCKGGAARADPARRRARTQGDRGAGRNSASRRRLARRVRAGVAGGRAHHYRGKPGGGRGMSLATETGATPVHGRTDAEDRLVFADETLASLQLRCGGELPGAIAVPELRELVAKTRRFGFSLQRDIRAFDGERTIRTWAEVTPDRSGEGCVISLANWRSVAASDSADADTVRRNACDRATADLIARLDAEQRVLHAVADATDLEELANTMSHTGGQDWKALVELEGIDHEQPLHWRLLDGSHCAVEGSRRRFTVRLLPLGRAQPGSEGFELLLVGDRPLAEGEIGAVPAPADTDASTSGMAGELGPVLRQPIARIIANAETIRSRLAGPLADEYSAYAADIATAGQHLLALVEHLADLEVVESHGFATAPDTIDLVDVARQATGILGMRARDKRIELVLPEEGASQPATGELRRVLQILLNLVGNAINYSPLDSTVKIAVGQQGNHAKISVSDEGPGLLPEQAARVFEKFERLGRSGDGGSGLGLHISRRLAEAMGGTLSVESEEGEGATFTLTLPRDPA